MGCPLSRPSATLSGGGPPALPRDRSARLTSADLRQTADAMSHPDDVEASRQVAAAAEAEAVVMFKENEGLAFRCVCVGEGGVPSSGGAAAPERSQRRAACVAFKAA
jgi:hypothetical protein